MFLQQAAEVARSLQTWQYFQRLQATLAVTTLCSLYLSVVVRRLSPSHTSLVTLLPVLLPNALLPITYPKEEIISRVCTSLLFTWLASFKAIGLCLGRGPLVGSWNIPQTTLLYMFPVYPRQVTGELKGRMADKIGSTKHALTVFLGNTVLLCVVGYILSYELPQVIANYLYGLALYGLLTGFMDGPAALLVGALQMEVVPPFDEPWLSTSLADWWGRRWNNTTSLLLRALVYDPIIEGRLLPRVDTEAALADSAGASEQQQQQQHVTKHRRPPAWLAAVGVAATFAVSGIMHEIILYLITPDGQYHPGLWFMFFFIQAPLLMFEKVTKRRLQRKGVRIHRLVAILATTSTVMLTATMFWYPPVQKHSDVARNIVQSLNMNVAAVLQSILHH